MDVLQMHSRRHELLDCSVYYQRRRIRSLATMLHPAAVAHASVRPIRVQQLQATQMSMMDGSEQAVVIQHQHTAVSPGAAAMCSSDAKRHHSARGRLWRMQLQPRSWPAAHTACGRELHRP